jgi:oligopeptidase B
MEDDSSAPAAKGNYLYFSKTFKGKDYPAYYRRLKKKNSPEELLLDVNELAKGKKYFSASTLSASPNGNILPYQVDEVGRRFYTIEFKDLKTGKNLTHSIKNTTGDFVWINNSEVFYTQQNPETLRAEKVLRFNILTGESKEVYFEKDDTFEVSLSKSLSERFIFLLCFSYSGTEVRVYDLSNASPSRSSSDFVVFSPRTKDVEYYLEDNGEDFLIRTNWDAKNFKLMVAPFTSTAKKDWRNLRGHSETEYLEDFLSFKDHVVASVRKDGLMRFQVYDRRLKAWSDIVFPDETYSAYFHTNLEFNSKTFRYNYSSMVQPDTVYDYKFAQKSSRVVKKMQVPHYDEKLYVTKRIWATAPDSTRIPVSLVYRKDLFRKGQNPVLQYGYGSYGYSVEADFDLAVVSLLDRGFVYAAAHIRGGQELGRDWYEQGRLKNKMNTFTDFIAVTEFLKNQNYCDPRRVYAQGGSAGGLLMGAIVNLRPGLYRGIHAGVPFVDALTTMLDASIPLTTSEYDQWGNPNNLEDYKTIRAYSPYDNILAQAYPHILVTTGYHDSQVQYWEPLKWISKLRDYNTDTNSILALKTEMSAGHSGVTGRFARLKKRAEEYSFFVFLEKSRKNEER